MTKSRRNLRAFGAGGLVVGLALVLAAPLGGDLDGLMRGYGAMLAASAGYMLAGLWLLGLRRPHASISQNVPSGEGLRRI